LLGNTEKTSNENMEKIELLTKSDLEEFKKDLLKEIGVLIQPQRSEGKKWLKSGEVRRLLNISPGTLQNLRINGTLAYTRVGSILYYKYADILKVLTDNDSNL
jgi:hypothetical protein